MARKFKLLIGVTGFARSGKDTVASMLAKKLKLPRQNMSDILAEELEQQGMEKTKENMTALVHKLHAKYGAAVLAQETLKRLKGDSAIVSGVRIPADILTFKENSERFVLVIVSAPENLRFERRNQQDASTFNEFFKRDREDVEMQRMDLVIKMADYRISNDGTLQELEAKVDKAIKELKLKSAR